MSIVIIIREGKFLQKSYSAMETLLLIEIQHFIA